MDLLMRRTKGDHFVEEGDKLLAGVALGSLAMNLAGLHVESGIQGESSVSKVFEPVPFGSARRQGQHRIQPVQSLYRGLFIDAENGGVRGRIQVQADDRRRFLFEIGIIAGHITFQPMRPDSGRSADSVNCILADAQMLGQLAAAASWPSICASARMQFTESGELPESGRIGWNVIWPAMIPISKRKRRRSSACT